ncbi:uncharacterized protein LOC129591149 [Paramacrobiotus metropolitanus]|uniref:uncharacterized protein LOC129591149 n=1 Tax=Paramacrobiotus metropolitanus TaxID=2943436 RepID=UPI002446038F|nr:uncharacterized protein LOC129591149 [Paramacrobiotus metropolitanus]
MLLCKVILLGLMTVILGVTTVLAGYYDRHKCFEVRCKFMFPMKPLSKGVYSFYSICNVRNITKGVKEFYCYGLFSSIFQDPGGPSLIKCCKTPPGYHIDYSRCEWKFTDDKRGEHYDGYWLAKCDTNEVMIGLGQAVNL